MNLAGILLYCGRAAAFAAVICGMYAVYCRLTGRKLHILRLLTIAYLAALVQITVIRGGVDFEKVFRGGRDVPQLIPLHTTIGQIESSLWQLIYHMGGNLIWFVPLGFILHKKSWHTVLLAGAALSLAIELGQYLLMTGMADIDDVIINAAGSWLGRAIAKFLSQRLSKPTESPL